MLAYCIAGTAIVEEKVSGLSPATDRESTKMMILEWNRSELATCPSPSKDFFVLVVGV
jgi:hypothetical protein